MFLAQGQNQEWDKRWDSILAIRNQERRGLSYYSIAWAVGGRPSSVSGTPPSSPLGTLSSSNKLPGAARVISNCSYIYSVTMCTLQVLKSSHILCLMTDLLTWIYFSYQKGGEICCTSSFLMFELMLVEQGGRRKTKWAGTLWPVSGITFSRSLDFQSSHVWADASGPRWATLGAR